MSYYENGNYDAAAREFQVAMMNDPKNPDFHANFAKSRQKMGDLAGAEHHFRQALTIARDHQPSYHGLAEVFLAQGRGQEAQEMLTTWAATQPYQPDAHVELAWLQQEMGDPNAAAQSLQKALQINPNHSTALAHLGQQYEDMGRPDQAVELYQNSLRSDWNQPDVHSRLAAASQKAGPSSAMAATAMGRGVHPYSVARQPSLMGPPSAGSQMAQMQIAQNQMAMAGYGNRMNQAGPGQMAMNPMMMPGAMSGYYSPSVSPSMMTASNPMMNSPMATMNPMNSGWHVASPGMSTSPTQTASTSFDGMFPVPNASNGMTFPMATTIQSPGTTSPSTNSAAVPTPDPTFSAASPTPVSTISLSQTSPVTTSPSSSEPPVVEAF
jgi:Tfp pilus assembly protein PilF